MEQIGIWLLTFCVFVFCNNNERLSQNPTAHLDLRHGTPGVPQHVLWEPLNWIILKNKAAALLRGKRIAVVWRRCIWRQGADGVGEGCTAWRREFSVCTGRWGRTSVCLWQKWIAAWGCCLCRGVTLLWSLSFKILSSMKYVVESEWKELN